jgi:hypothetical protein
MVRNGEKDTHCSLEVEYFFNVNLAGISPRNAGEKQLRYLRY